MDPKKGVESEDDTELLVQIISIVQFSCLMFVNCFFSCDSLLKAIFYLVRLGPSASEAGVRSAVSPLVGLVDHLAQVKQALKDPSVREVVANISPQLLSLFPESDDEMEDAKQGKPAGSKPSPTSPEPSPSPPGPATATPPAKPAFTPAPADDVINSGTHRAAHARLVRRMERADPAVFPNMCKLWQSGTRKDYMGNGSC